MTKKYLGRYSIIEEDQNVASGRSSPLGAGGKKGKSDILGWRQRTIIILRFSTAGGECKFAPAVFEEIRLKKFDISLMRF